MDATSLYDLLGLPGLMLGGALAWGMMERRERMKKEDLLFQTLERIPKMIDVLQAAVNLLQRAGDQR